MLIEPFIYVADHATKGHVTHTHETLVFTNLKGRKAENYVSNIASVIYKLIHSKILYFICFQ